MEGNIKVRAKARFLSQIPGVGARKRGDEFLTSPSVAQHLKQLDLVDILVPPAQKPAGPTERKPAGPGERKDPPAHPLRRLDGVTRFSAVDRAWEGKTVVILGGGPSLVMGDGLERIRSSHDREGRAIAVLAVNDAYKVAPHAGVLYAADGRWWNWHAKDEDLAAFAGQRVTVDGSAGEGNPGPDGYVLRSDSLIVYSRDPERLASGGNGGYQAINLAALAGAARIVLLGYDMKHKAGRQNWHKGHPIKSPDRWVRQWIPRFRELAAELKADGVEIFNASEETALDAFPRRPIAELLPHPGDRS